MEQTHLLVGMFEYGAALRDAQRWSLGGVAQFLSELAFNVC